MAQDLLHTTSDRAPLIDSFGRHIDYVRISVTDRCDFRCTYCMSEHMTFLPKQELLTLEELDRMASAFVARGVKRLRLTGGEPLVRRNIMWLFERLARHLDSGALEDLTLTTNGSQLEKHAKALAALGVSRVNISIDTLDPKKFQQITRWGRLEQVLRSVDAADAAGLKIKINMVALKNFNEDAIDDMLQWCGARGYDMTLIETMPLGEIDEDRTDQYLPLSHVRQDLSQRWTLTPSEYKTGGPARYVNVEETGQRLGFITPLTHNFCESCNRVRVTCTGTLFMCLGQEDQVDLLGPLRQSDGDDLLHAAFDKAMIAKPKGHDFVIERRGAQPAVTRHMSMTGG
ncbi:MAG: GTP 3',8-cyclase MoaA [Pseudomonadota bacterium]